MSADAPSRDHEAAGPDQPRHRPAFVASADCARAAKPCSASATRSPNDDRAQTLVALGGDGFMLHTLHRMLEGECPHLPVFGMNRGTVGFLMNEWRLDGPRRAHRRGQGDPRRAAGDAGDDGRRQDLHPCRDQRSLAAARNAPDGQDRGAGQRPCRHARAGLRRRARRDARRARPPTTSPRTARSCRSRRRCSR